MSDFFKDYLTMLIAPVTTPYVLYKDVTDKSKAVTGTYEAYNNYKNALDSYGSADSNVKDVLTTLQTFGFISESDWSKASKAIEKYDKNKKDGLQLSDLWADTFTGNKTHQELTDVFNLIADKLPAFYDKNKTLQDNILSAMQGSVPSIADAPRPEYLDTDFAGHQLTVDPISIMTGQELADLHGINYNPDDYYNLIKQGTSADVDYAKYLSNQMNQASMVQDQSKVVSYLDSIRNSKAESLANGATAGAKAANELLANTSALNDYVAGQADVAQNRYANTNKALQADAQAAITARDYFNNLATSLGSNISSIYANDVDFQGQQLLSNAELYTADQNLRGNRAYANAQMEAAYAQSQAAINAARQSANNTADEYTWLFNTFQKANEGNTLQTILDMNSYITNRYTGFNNLVDLYNNKN